MQVNLSRPLVFQSPDGQCFIFNDYPKFEDFAFFSPDGQSFYELAITGKDGSYRMDTGSLWFQNPHHNQSGVIALGKDTLMLDGVPFHKSERWDRETIEAVPLPCQFTMRPSEHSTMFTSEAGQSFLYLHGERDEVFFSSDGLHFNQLCRNLDRSFTDPHQHKKGTLIRVNDDLLLDPLVIGQRHKNYSYDWKQLVARFFGDKFFLIDRVIAEHAVSLLDLLRGTAGIIRATKDALLLGGVIFNKAPSPAEITLIRIPVVRQLMYLFKLADGRFIYVSGDKYRWSEESVKLFIGFPGSIREVKVKSFSSLRDGGTSSTSTVEEILKVPSPERQEAGEAPTWGRFKLEELDPAAFRITETEQGVRITRRHGNPLSEGSPKPVSLTANQVRLQIKEQLAMLALDQFEISETPEEVRIRSKKPSKLDVDNEIKEAREADMEKFRELSQKFAQRVNNLHPGSDEACAIRAQCAKYEHQCPDAETFVDFCLKQFSIIATLPQALKSDVLIHCFFCQRCQKRLDIHRGIIAVTAFTNFDDLPPLSPELMQKITDDWTAHTQQEHNQTDQESPPSPEPESTSENDKQQ